MYILPPITITDAMITACNITETAPAAYVGGTTYASGDLVSVAGSAGALLVYKSLQAGNTGHTPASSPTWWEYQSTTYGEWNSGTTYASGDRVIIASTHLVYESLQGANTNKAPATEPTWWLEVGNDNRWAMFDSKVGTQTENYGEITITLTPGQVIDSIAFLDVDAAEISIVMTDPVEGIVYTETLDLVGQGRVIDGYTYFFEPIILTDAAVLIGVPPYGSAEIAITITNTGGTAKIGTLALGINRSLGNTLQEPTVGIIDYSRKTVDDFGNYSITQRSYSKRMTCKVWLENNSADELQRILADYRATAVIWIGAEEYSSLIIYGFYKNHSIVIEAAAGACSYCDLEVEGLV